MPDTTQPEANSTPFEELERRIERLRKSGRESRFGLIALTAAFVLVVGFDVIGGRKLGLVTEGLVKAPRVIITDDEGKRRAELGTGPDGTPHLTLYDQRQRPRFIATQFEDTVRLCLSDGHGRDIELRLIDGGSASLAFREEGRVTRVAIGVTSNGDASVRLNDAAEHVRLALQACDTGDSGLLTFDDTGAARFVAGVTPDGKPLLNMLDASEQPRIKLGESPEGWPALDMVASDGTLRATLHTPDEWACLTLRGPRGESTAKTWVDEFGLARAIFCDPDGKLMWSVPPEWYTSLKSRCLEESLEAAEDSEDAKD